MQNTPKTNVQIDNIISPSSSSAAELAQLVSYIPQQHVLETFDKIVPSKSPGHAARLRSFNLKPFPNTTS
jgi:hypothetical protein